MENNKIDKKMISLITLGIIIYLIISNPKFLDAINKAVTPLFLAFAFAYMLDKLICFITRNTRLSRSVAIIITIIAILFIVIILFAIVVPNLIENAANLVESLSDIDKFEIPAKFTKAIDNKYLLEINEYIKNSFEEFISKIGEISGEILKSVVTHAFAITSGMIKFVLAFVIAIYMLSDKKDLIVRMKRTLFAYYDYKKSLNIIRIFEIADNIFSDYFIGKLIDSTIIGILCYISTQIFGIPNSLIIALIIGVTNMIPYIGPFIGAIPVIIITLLILPSKTLLMIFIILVLQQFDGLVLGPIILGDKMKVSAFWIIIAVTIGGALQGFIGMLLGVPVLVLIKTVVEEMVNNKLIEKNLIGIDELKIPEKKSESLFIKIKKLLKNK